MTDKQHDTQKAAGELRGRTHNRHTEQATGTRQETHGSHGTHNRQQERRTSGGKAGRKGGERDADGLAPGGAVEGSREGRKTHGSRGRSGRDQKKEYVIYLRER